MNYGDTDVSKAAYPKFLEKLSICRDLFHGFSYEKFMTGSDLDRAKLISGGVNFILGKSVAEYELPDHEKTQNVFIKEALLLKQALSGNSEDIKKNALFKEMYRWIDNSVHLNVNDMFDAALRNTRIEMSSAERRQFYEKHIRHMTLTIDENGNVSIELKRG